MRLVLSSLLLGVSASSLRIARYGSSLISVHLRLIGSQRTKANKQAIESLAPRVKALAGQLCEGVPEDDVEEVERRKKLEE